MIFNIILLVILATSLIIVLLIVVKKLSLVAAVELDVTTKQQAETKKHLLQQKFRRDCQAWKCRLGSFLKQMGRIIKFVRIKIFPPKNPPQTQNP